MTTLIDRRRAMAALIATSAAACQDPAPAAKGPGPIRFAVLATDNAQSAQAAWEPLIVDMRKRTGLNVTAYYTPNYSAQIEAMRFKQIEAGWFGNMAAIEAVDRAQGEVFAQVTDPEGLLGYQSVIIVPASSGLTLERLLACDHTLNFGTGDAQSTSGTLAPMAFLFTPRGVTPTECFKTVRSSNHDANFQAVAASVLDAAANNTEQLRTVGRKSPELAARVKVIWTSPLIPKDPLVWRKDLDPAVKSKLKTFFLAYGQSPGAEGERERAVLKALDFGGFHASSDAQLLPVRRMRATAELAEAKAQKNLEAIARAQAALDRLNAIPAS